MAQRGSGYARQQADAYWTPAWVYNDLFSVEPSFEGCQDIAPRERDGYDFLSDPSHRLRIATNPPFNQSDAFVRHALEVTRPIGSVAMLLPVTWATAKKRIPLFEVPFKGIFFLTRRIRWENLEQKKNGPSTNHAWYIWDWLTTGKPTVGWV